MHDCLDDELVVLGDIKDGATGPRVGQLDEGLVAEGVLRVKQSGGAVKSENVPGLYTH